MKPSYQDFKSTLEEIFGQNLTDRADLATKDFWNNWDDLYGQLKQGLIVINVDALMLGQKLPEYKKYHPIKGAAKLIFLAGIVTLFFNWKIGLGVIGLGVIINIYGSTVKNRTKTDFAENILTNINEDNLKEGMGTLCSHYIAGTVQLNGDNGKAHWPQFPSNVLTGDTDFIPNEKG